MHLDFYRLVTWQ